MIFLMEFLQNFQKMVQLLPALINSMCLIQFNFIKILFFFKQK